MLPNQTAPHPVTADNLTEKIRAAFDRENIFTKNGLIASAFQKEILSAREHRFWIIACGRQCGKTTAISGLVVHEALTIPNSNIILAAPSERQVKNLARVIKELIRGAGYYNELKSESQTLLEFVNGSRILAVPGRSETIRGFSNITLAAIDEGAYCSSDLFLAIQPMMLSNPRSRFFVLSTPCGKASDNWFNKTWHADNAYRKLRVRTSDCIHIDAEMLEAMRRELGALAAQELDAEFLAEHSRLIDPAFLAGKFEPLGRL